MKNNKLLASLKKAIQAAEHMMETSTAPSMDSSEENISTTLVGSGGSKTVYIKRADFSKPHIGMIEYVECAAGKCPPEEFKGRCCIFDVSAGWNCVEGLMASECAQQGGIYEANVNCNSQPPCGGNFGVEDEEEMPVAQF